MCVYLCQSTNFLNALVFLRYIDHSQALKHDVDIPDNLGTGQAVGGGRRYSLAVLSCSL